MTQIAEPVFPEQEYALCIREFETPYLFDKLARDWGVQPQNEAEAQQILDMAEMLWQQKEASAPAGNSFLADASDSLKNALASQGIPALPTSYDHLVKQAAATKLQNNDLFNAAASVGKWLGEMAQRVAG